MNQAIRSPHIILVTSSYPYRGEGGQACAPFAWEFAQALARHARVSVVAAGPESESVVEGDIRVRRFRVPTFPVSRLRFGNPADWPSILKVIAAGQHALNQTLLQDGADYVLACWAIPAGLWAMRSGKKFGVRYGVWALGSDILVAGKNPLARMVIRQVLRGADSCFADGFALKDEASRLAAKPCLFLPTSRTLPAVGNKALRSRPPYRLTFLGRWHPVKGLDLLMEALQQLDAKDWRKIESVRIFGSGPMAAFLRDSCTALARAGHPVFLEGALNADGVGQALYETDFLMIPSRSESIPVVFSEAMQMRCPIIATPVGDLPLLQQEHGMGFIADDVSSNSLAQAIRKALASSPESLAGNLEQAARIFDTDRAARCFLDSVRMEDH